MDIEVFGYNHFCKLNTDFAEIFWILVIIISKILFNYTINYLKIYYICTNVNKIEVYSSLAKKEIFQNRLIFLKPINGFLDVHMNPLQQIKILCFPPNTFWRCVWVIETT